MMMRAVNLLGLFPGSYNKQSFFVANVKIRSGDFVSFIRVGPFFNCSKSYSGMLLYEVLLHSLI